MVGWTSEGGCGEGGSALTDSPLKSDSDIPQVETAKEVKQRQKRKRKEEKKAEKEAKRAKKDAKKARKADRVRVRVRLVVHACTFLHMPANS